MRHVVMSVFDAAVGAYMRPFFVQSRGQGLRLFSDEVRRSAPDNPIHQHPGDMSLWFLGFWDEDTGLFEEVSPERIATGSQYQFES